MPWYSDCPRCREAFAVAGAHDHPGTRALPAPAEAAALVSEPVSDRPNTLQLSRSVRQTLHHYLPRAVAAALSATVFCLTGVFSTLDLTPEPADRTGPMGGPAAASGRVETHAAADSAAATAANPQPPETPAGHPGPPTPVATDSGAR